MSCEIVREGWFRLPPGCLPRTPSVGGPSTFRKRRGGGRRPFLRGVPATAL
ncbi:MAG: hypothetical protein OXF02_01480 [Simkaniaceae bacterium]|nr:hypothetical protein [Simkaniaceae bacterium]